MRWADHSAVDLVVEKAARTAVLKVEVWVEKLAATRAVDLAGDSAEHLAHWMAVHLVDRWAHPSAAWSVESMVVLKAVQMAHWKAVHWAA